MTAPIAVHVDLREFVRTSRDLQRFGRQVPYALSRALNWTADSARGHTVDTLDRYFKVRQRRWIGKGIRTQRSHKTNLTAWVGTRDSWMAEHVTGSIRHGKDHRRTLPTRETVDKKTSRGKFRSDIQVKRVLSDPKKRAFLVNLRDGRSLVIQRIGRRKPLKRAARKGASRKSSTRLLWVLKDEQPIERRWPLRSVVAESVGRTFRPHFRRAMWMAAQTARRGRR